jgi:hypothetical protein
MAGTWTGSAEEKMLLDLIKRDLAVHGPVDDDWLDRDPIEDARRARARNRRAELEAEAVAREARRAEELKEQAQRAKDRSARERARRAGKTRYKQSKACRNGHHALRRVSTGACTLCEKIRKAAK